MCDSEDVLLEDLKRNYTKLGHKLFMAGISQIKLHYKGCLSVAKIKQFLSSVYTYSIHKESHENVRNPYFIRFKRQQWQIDLIQITNISAENDNNNFILT